VQARGTHFDPDVVDAFLANEDKFIAIGQALAEPARATDREAQERHDLVRI
jgi:hypothetical protein